MPDGLGTALKPAFEPIVLARKPLSEGTVAANVMKWRTGAINIDATRIRTSESTARPSYERKTSKGTPGGAFGNANRERHMLETPYVAGGHSEGRWPANVVHDGSDEVTGMFPATGPSKAANRGVTGRHDPGQGAEHNRMKDYSASVRGHDDAGGSAARFFYSAKASKADRAGSKHPTVKPIALMQWLARLITPPGGVCLDPFAGSGSTGAAAVAEGFKCILIERESEYVADIRARFEQTAVAA